MAGNLIVSERLDEDVNYDLWSIQVKTYLVGQDLWDVVEADGPSATLHGDNFEAEIKAWRKKDTTALHAIQVKNATALHAIQISCESVALSVIKDITSAKSAWATLADEFGEDSGKSLYLVT